MKKEGEKRQKGISHLNDEQTRNKKCKLKNYLTFD